METAETTQFSNEPTLTNNTPDGVAVRNTDDTDISTPISETSSEIPSENPPTVEGVTSRFTEAPIPLGDLVHEEEPVPTGVNPNPVDSVPYLRTMVVGLRQEATPSISEVSLQEEPSRVDNVRAMTLENWVEEDNSSVPFEQDSAHSQTPLVEVKALETSEKFNSPDIVFLSSADTKISLTELIKTQETPVVSAEKTDVTGRSNPFHPVEKIAPTEQKNPFPLIEKNSSEVAIKNTSESHAIITSSTDISDDQQPLIKFEEWFTKTLPIEEFPWESKKKPISIATIRPENPEDETPFSRAIRWEGSHTSTAIRSFWAVINDNLSAFDSAIDYMGAPDDNEEAKLKARALFDNVYNAIESFQQDVFDATEADVKDFIDPEDDSAFAMPEMSPEAPIGRWESLERWARWVGRNEDGIIILKKAPYWSEDNESEVCSTEGVRDSGVDIYLLADVLKESDITNVRKLVREASKMKAVDFMFRHPKEVRNSTGRLLTSREEATISGSTIGYVTIEGFFETLAYVLAKSSKMTE